MISLFFLILLTRSFVFASSFNGGIGGLNPENDPIYDPHTRTFQVPTRNAQNVDQILLPPPQVERLSFAPTSHSYSPSSLQYSSPNSYFAPSNKPLVYHHQSQAPQNSHTHFWSSSRSHSQEPSPVSTSYLVPEAAFMSNHQQRPRSCSSGSGSSYPLYPAVQSQRPFYPNQINDLYVPEVCINFDRMWDFYVGFPKDMTDPIGWVSRIGYADNIIKDLGLKTMSSTYTLVSSKKNVRSVVYKLPSSYFFEVFGSNPNLFYNLYDMSYKLDKGLRSAILAVTITFDFFGYHSIRIIVDPEMDSNVPENSVHGQLSSIGIALGPYAPYNTFF